MDMPNLFSAKSPVTDQKRYLALVVTDATIQAALWTIHNGHITVIFQSPIHQYSDEKNLLVQTDEALQELGKDSENVDEVIFGLELGWVSSKGITDEKKPLLKKISQELSLKPTGFVVVTETLFHTLTRFEPHVSTILLQYSSGEMLVTWIERGKLVMSEKVGRSSDSVADLKEALARLRKKSATHTHIPGKLYLVAVGLSQAELLEEQQRLLTHEWGKAEGFIHPPTVDVMPDQTVMNAVIQEGGRAVAESQGLIITSVSSQPDITAPEMTQGDTMLENQSALSDETVMTDQTPAVAAASHTQFAHKKTSWWSRIFSRKSKNAKASSRAIVKPAMPTFKPRKKVSHRHFAFGGFLAGLAALILIAAGLLIYSKKALVSLTLTTKSISDDIKIQLDPGISESDIEQHILKAQTVTTSVKGNKTIDTTGVKLVGEKAKGKLTLFNKTNNEKTFDAGTTLKSGKLTFVLDDEVKVASASVSSTSGGETKTYGKADTTATATTIGADYNINEKTELQIESFSPDTYSATTTEAFIGGSSREIRVVSKDDQTKLLNDLQTELTQQAQKELQNKATDGEYVVPTGKAKIISATYDGEIGSEQKTLGLAAELEITALSYSMAELKPLISVALTDKIPSGYELSSAEPDVLSKPAAATSAAVVDLETNVSAMIQPIINQEAWKQEIAGQPKTSAEAILRGKGAVSSVEISIMPKLLEWIYSSLPSQTKAIEFEIKQ